MSRIRAVNCFSFTVRPYNHKSNSQQFLVWVREQGFMHQSNQSTPIKDHNRQCDLFSEYGSKMRISEQVKMPHLVPQIIWKFHIRV